MEKVHNFLEFRKNLKFDDTPLVPNVGKILNWEIFEFSEPPPLKTRNIGLKHLKLPKNPFKTNLFFLQLVNTSSMLQKPRLQDWQNLFCNIYKDC